jgi:hypothetical protein
LVAAAEDAERRRALTREMLRRDRAGGAGPQPAEVVRLDHRGKLGPVGREERDDEHRAFLKARVHLRAGVAELEVRRSHVGQSTLVERQASPRGNRHTVGRHAAKALLDGLDCVERLEQRLDILLAQVQRHVPGQSTRSPSR